MAKRQYVVGGLKMRCRPIDIVPDWLRYFEAKRRELDIPKGALCKLIGVHATYWDVLHRDLYPPKDWEQKKATIEFALEKAERVIRGE